MSLSCTRSDAERRRFNRLEFVLIFWNFSFVQLFLGLEIYEDFAELFSKILEPEAQESMPNCQRGKSITLAKIPRCIDISALKEKRETLNQTNFNMKSLIAHRLLSFDYSDEQTLKIVQIFADMNFPLPLTLSSLNRQNWNKNDQ